MSKEQRMENDSNSNAALEADVNGRFDILPNFFRSASAAPELLERLRQIVDHLMSNAVEFTPAGGKVQLTHSRSVVLRDETASRVANSGSNAAPLQAVQRR
jgi:signal transduction histidine kinase